MSLDTFLATRTDRCPGCGFHPAHQACACHTDEWALFVAALRQAASASSDGRVHQHHVRPLIRGRVFHKHVGQLYARAKREGVLRPVDEEQSKDSAGRNTHHKSPVYELRSA